MSKSIVQNETLFTLSKLTNFHMFVFSCKCLIFYQAPVFMGTQGTSWIKNLLRHVLQVITILKYLVHIVLLYRLLERSTGTRAMYIHVHIYTAQIYFWFFHQGIIYFPHFVTNLMSFCLIYTSFFRQSCSAASYHRKFSSLSDQIT